MEYKGPFVTDIIIVKGLRCPAGYVLLASTQSGDRASLTRKSITKADIFLCVKKETDPKIVITDVLVLDVGREVVPPGFQLIDSRAGGLKNMVAVKRAPRDAARSFVVDICVTIQKKEKLTAAWHVVPKTLGDDVLIAYKIVRVESETPRPPSRPPMQRQTTGGAGPAPVSPSSSMYPDPDGPALLGVPTLTSHRSEADLGASQTYHQLDGVAVELQLPTASTPQTPGGAITGPPLVPLSNDRVMHEFDYDTSLEQRLLAA